MKTVTFLNQKYQLLENYKDGYESEAVEYLFTEYFLDLIKLFSNKCNLFFNNFKVLFINYTPLLIYIYFYKIYI